jgi:hypothetical protein
VKEKTPGAETTENFGEFSIPLKDLRYFQKKYEIDKYHLNYYVQTKNTRHDNGTYLVELQII